MNFSGHLTGAVTAGTAVSFTTYAVGIVSVGNQSFVEAFANPLESGGWQRITALFLITVFMGIFPDLDTASIPQRWFYRLVWVGLIYLYLNRRYDLFAVITVAALLPLLHQHRGWTHWKSTPWVISFCLAVLYEYYRAKESWFSSFQWENIPEFYIDYWVYMLAGILGHYTHLFLDSKKFRLFWSGYADKRHH